MSTAHAITLLLIDEGMAARAHFQVYWALRNLALPKYHGVMNDANYRDFFLASNSGHYKLFFLALSKIFDRDSRVAGISELKRALRSEGQGRTALRITRELRPIPPFVKKLMHIRNQTIVHNEISVPRTKVYEVNGITLNQLRQVIEAVCGAINATAHDLGIPNRIFDSSRFESATLGMLERLGRGTVQLGAQPRSLRSPGAGR